MSYRIIVTPEARDQLDAIYDYIAYAATPGIARQFTDGIIDRLAVLTDYPQTGSPRDDIRSGLRTLAYRRRVTVAFMVEEVTVVVIGFYYGGQDFETILRDEQP
ncbi:MAG: type II toxin-antitoxin system RelE/ParE family toxin [Sphingomonadales bacterium]|nr:MAG: type II toxin-antitoxin system RelE/ParE family toxin [Sphingomonadales bacterium]TNF03488.1 MAG: type II toxin-antitoxin system RelE/ParE family toxin [Sphingomonadales bacterium]